ncbi:hypothetical protein P0082_09415 [Candidatus Haliotispira prima]|uniref:Lipoprotein n=1 Tax=Candidatus Haliotispira prima TaxID=3034016 RepID=A0ABY8MIQ2_9SPIO|nr:hypothetical protein P0082_09415 [Candidatus Haliotispira prima]
MVLSGCEPLSDSKDSPPADSPPAPTNTFTISFTGIQAVELTVNLIEDMAVSAIVRLADEPAPVWADIKDKVGLLTRNIVANTPKRIFTAKHYGTNDSLKTNIGAMSAADILQPETAYKVYILSDKSVIETLPFTTVAIPPASAFPSTSIGYSLNFAPSVLLFESLYEVYGKKGEVLLIPLYMSQLLTVGWSFFTRIKANDTVRVSCDLNSCLANSGVALMNEYIYEDIAMYTYHKILLGFQSFAGLDEDKIRIVSKDNDRQSYTIDLITGK